MEPDGTVSPPSAQENTSFPKGASNTWTDGQPAQEAGNVSADQGGRKHDWSKDPTSWGYLLLHNKKVDQFETEVNQDGHCRCFVHRSVVYEKVRHGVRKVEKPTISGFVFLQGTTEFLKRYLRDNYPPLHLVNDRTTHTAAVIPDHQMQPFMQIMKDDPSRVRILLHPIAYYAHGNARLRVLTGVLKGQEGYLVRISRDHKLVMAIGDLTVAVGGVHKEQFEQVDRFLKTGHDPDSSMSVDLSILKI